MVKVSYERLPGFGLRIAIRGHAGAGEKGADPVCAALSMLMYTAAETAMELAREGRLRSMPRVRLRSGDSEVVLYPRKESIGEVNQRCAFAELGFRMLAEQYPENAAWA